jgi:hypothetical protein
MPVDTTPQNNYDRLLKRIGKNSLAAQLVQAYLAPEANGPDEAMKTVLRERLAKVREQIDRAKN